MILALLEDQKVETAHILKKLHVTYDDARRAFAPFILDAHAPDSDAHLPRKLTHMAAGMVIPSLLQWQVIPHSSVLWGTVACFALFMMVEGARFSNPTLNAFFMKNFAWTLKRGETNTLTGATYMLGGAALSMLMFEPPIAAVALYCVAIGDPLAAIVGKRYGFRRYRNGRSFEGSMAMFIACVVVMYIVGDYPAPLLFAAATVATLAEAFSGTLDDNLTVPTLTGAVLVALG
jgi:dolichol kinase